MKLPIRGPCELPSSVSYSALNQSRRFSKPAFLADGIDNRLDIFRSRIFGQTGQLLVQPFQRRDFNASGLRRSRVGAMKSL